MLADVKYDSRKKNANIVRNFMKSYIIPDIAAAPPPPLSNRQKTFFKLKEH
jgi:hypothetical protein